jgi:PEP-CTERM motif
MNTTRIAVWAALVASMMTAPASATTLNLIQANTNRGEFLSISFSGVERTSFAGAVSFSINGSSTLFDMFCVDLTTHAYLNSPYEAIALPPTTIDNGLRAAWLFETYNASAQTVVSGAALQLALWDIVHDGGNGLSTGLFQSTTNTPADVIAAASILITASQGHTSANAVVWQSVLGKSDRQSMISETPEPGTIGLLASGLVLVGWRARRKQA